MTQTAEQAVEIGLLIEGKDGIRVHYETIGRQYFTEMLWVAGNLTPEKAEKWRRASTIRSILAEQWPPMLYDFISAVCHSVLVQNASQEGTAYVLVLPAESEGSLIIYQQGVAEHFRNADAVVNFWAACQTPPLKQAV